MKPIIKWVGGKSQIIEQILEKFPDIIENYYEPFAGGGSVFLALLSNQTITIKGNMYISDKNQGLIELYQDIKNNVEKLIKKLNKIVSLFESAKNTQHAKRHQFIFQEYEFAKEIAEKRGKTALYYYFRNWYNSHKQLPKCAKSALFIFLNKTCFRGLYREGNNGFNVPYGNYNSPKIFNPDELRRLHNAFNKYNIHFICQDFIDTLPKIKNGDFVYLDPPYCPVNKTSFVDYSKNGFDKHEELAKMCTEINQKKIKFLASNAYCQQVIDLYKNFNIKKIKCKRLINSKTPQSHEYEVLISN